MSEYLIQNTTLTGIADAIRPLLGLTGTMTPEQMQTNLTTEQANIAAALGALAEKGVEVPEGANSNALAGLIAAIEAGGDISYTTGTITPEETIVPTSSARYYIEHNLGTKPTLFILMRTGYVTEKTANDYILIVATKKQKMQFFRTSTGYSGSLRRADELDGGDNSSGTIGSCSSTKLGVGGYQQQLTAGHTYTWMAFSGVTI